METELSQNNYLGLRSKHRCKDMFVYAFVIMDNVFVYIPQILEDLPLFTSSK